MNISIIIACYNVEKYITNCLESVFKSDISDFEVIAVDDGSTDDTLKILQSFEKHSNLILKQTDRNAGPSKGRNIGTKYASGEILVFIDSDTVIDRSCLSVLYAFFHAHPHVAAAQCQLLNPSGTLESAGHFLSFTGFPYEIGVGGNPSHYRESVRIFGAKTAGMAIRATVFHTIGGFDEDYIIYGEDTDMSYRIWLAGYKMNYIPQARITHFGKSSLTNKTKKRLYYEGPKNMINVILKNTSVEILYFMLPMNIIIWLFISAKTLLRNDLTNTINIYKAIWWNIVHIRKTFNKRQNNKINGRMRVLPNEIIFGDVSLKMLMQKGWRWFTNV